MNRFALILLLTLPLVACGGWKEVTKTKKLNDSVYNAAFFDKENGLAVGYSGFIQFSENGGDRWRGGMNNSWCLYGIERLGPDTFIASGNAGHVVVSTDHGRTWVHGENFGSTYPQNARYLSFATENGGWVATVTRLAETSNRGQSWTEMSLPGEVSSIAAICNTGPGAGYLFDYKGTLYKTADGGQSWSKMGQVGSGLPLRNELSTRRQTASLRFSGDNGLLAFAGEDKETCKLYVFRTKDGGQSWTADKPLDITFASTVYISRDMKSISAYHADQTLSLYRQG